MAGIFGYSKEERAAANKKASADWESKQGKRRAAEKRLLEMPVRKTEGGRYGANAELAPFATKSVIEDQVDVTATHTLRKVLGASDTGEKGVPAITRHRLKQAGVE